MPTEFVCRILVFFASFYFHQKFLQLIKSKIMPLEEDLSSFKLWATKLGFPMADMPNDDSLKSIFKSRQRDLFSKLIERVKPRQEVTEIRENILIKKLKKIDGQLVPQCSRSFLPKEKQIFLKVQDLKQEKSRLADRIAEHNKEHELLAQTIKTRNIQIMRAQHEHDTLESKVNVFYLKSHALDKNIANEQQNKERLIHAMPVKLNAKNACETTAIAAVDSALKELDEFYNFYINNIHSHNMQDAKKDLWKKLRIAFNNIPNFLIFNSIVRFKEGQVQHLISLNKSNIDESLTRTSGHSTSGREPLSTFELKLMKTKAELLGIVAKYLAARHECALTDERFPTTYLPFVSQFQKKFNNFYVGTEGTEEDLDHVGEQISNYILQLNMRSFRKAQNDFLTQQIQLYKAHLDTGARQLEDHEVLLSSIKQVYTEISTSINRIRYEMIMLGQIKDKIVYSKNMLQHMLNDLQTSNSVANSTKSNFLSTKLKLGENVSFIGGGGDYESIDGGAATASAVDGSLYINAKNNSDNIFCSTAYDLDSIMMQSMNKSPTLGGSMNMSVRNTTKIQAAGCGPSGRLHMLPPHSTELSTFAGIPFEKFNRLSKECSFYLAPNPVIMSPRESMTVLQLSPGVLLTAYGALLEVCNRIQLAKAIEDIPSDAKHDIDLTLVKSKELQYKIKQQSDKNSELLDKIEFSIVNLNHTYKNANKLFEFIIENPLRNYIPPKRLFKDLTYMDFESEFTMYYRMATVADKFK